MKRMTLNAAELDKFIILNGAFGFTDETLEHVSQDKLFSKIIEVIGNRRPVLIFDTTNIELYVGNTDEDTMYLTALYNNTANSYTIDYDKDTDKLRIEQASETFISEDNVKTLFGDQSIIGTGNIDLYNHQLLINDDCYFNIISSNGLPIDSIQDLTTVLKPTTKNIYYFGNQKATLTAGSLEYDKTTNTWKYRIVGGELTLVSNVSDVVITI